jgi:DNA-directed RNA polymerase specialized sigma24 family protein
MPSEGSVTRWIDLLQAGDPAAAQPLWERYFHLLVELARRKLGDKPRIADQEDVALSAFDSFCRGLRHGRFPDLKDRDNLWKLLVVLTARKAIHLIRDEGRLKRGGGQTTGTAQELLEEVMSQEPSPAFAAEVAENCQRLLDLLCDAELRTIALSKMEGYTNEEIAGQRNCAPRTVERKLRLICSLWKKECPV